MVTISAAILRGVRVHEPRREPPAGSTPARQFWLDLKLGVRFVARHRLLVALAIVVGCWQACHQAAIVVQILFATRTLGLSEQAVGLSYTGMGVGTVLASVFGNRISRRIGPGPCLILGFAVCGAGWLALAFAPANAWGVAAFALMLMMFSTGAVFIFINFLALRQAVTPAPLLGRMTSTMRWLILIPAGLGALLGGWLGEHAGLRVARGRGGGRAVASRHRLAVRPIRCVRERRRRPTSRRGARRRGRRPPARRHHLRDAVERIPIDVPERIETLPSALVPRALPRAGDGKRVNDAIRASHAELARWMPWAGTMPSVDESEAHCRRQQARFLLREDFVLLMFVRGADGGEGELVGGTGLHRID